ncbi:MAG: alpha/beta fold hydrolase, partial [Leptospirales bacterium]
MQKIETPVRAEIPDWPGPSSEIETGRLRVDSVELAWYAAGQGIPVVCLHALGHSAEDYTTLLSAPPPGLRIIAFDFPGHGRSAAIPLEGVASATYANLIARCLDQMRLARPVLVGNSIGGATALRLAAVPAIDARGLVLSNPGGLDNRKFPGDLVLAAMVRFFDAGARGRRWFPAAFARYYRFV